MTHTFSSKIASELSLGNKQVQNVIQLLEEGATIPFISRYRKEMTEGLDEVQIEKIRDRNEQLIELEKRREAILKSVSEQGKLTTELQKLIEGAETLSRLEDIYLPYKPKRKTRATMAKEKGLEPLGLFLLDQTNADPYIEAEKYIDAEKGVNSLEEALAGARDIVAEVISEDANLRGQLREFTFKTAIISSKVIKSKEEEAAKYKDYFEWSEPLKSVPSHRLLAMRRGEKELLLHLDISPSEEEAEAIIQKQYVKGRGPSVEQIKLAITDSYKRLLKPSLETESRLNSKLSADEESIKVFRENLRELLLAAPLGQKNIMAIDPGFRTGCKVVCLDRQGRFLVYETIFPHTSAFQLEQAKQTVIEFVKKYEVEAIAIGNGTAGRETEDFVGKLDLADKPLIVMVNESGASVYSASEVARDEFPDKDVTVRGAISIGRRLLDPLSELVKIDPKSIGVGQYQHDVDQNKLKQSLDDEVISCVNSVGVELNTASKQLLSYVSGLSANIAQNIVEYRNTNGKFKSRDQLKKVPRLGEKSYEQAAGFLRILDAENPLDASAVHPESYHIVEKMAQEAGCKVKDLILQPEQRKKIEPKKYVTDKVGLPTIQDILQELAKPGRDPRQQFEAFQFASGVEKVSDLRVGMELPGIVTNVANFGAFVDVGVHQDGLVHISQISDVFVSDPRNVLKVGQKVKVRVMEVDEARKRISLSMKTGEKKAAQKPKQEKPQEAVSDFQDKLIKLKQFYK